MTRPASPRSEEDASWSWAVVPDATLEQLAPGTWMGGSPAKVFRVSHPGDEVLRELLAAGRWVPHGRAESVLADRLLASGAAHPHACSGHDAAPERLSVVVPVRDDERGVSELLDDLGADPPVEVIVVDDGSADPDALERAVAGRARLVRFERSSGPAAARNRGLALVATEFVAFVDADVRCPAGWLGPLLWHLEHTGAVVAAPRVASSGGSGAIAAWERSAGSLDLGREPARVAPLTRVAYVPSAALVARTSSIRDLGGFDESLRVGEDVDLVWRVVRSGGLVRYEPASTVTHRARSDLGSWLEQRYRYGTSAACLDERHPGKVAPVAVAPGALLSWSAALSGRPLPAGLFAAVAAATLRRKIPEVDVRRVLSLALRGQADAGSQLVSAVVRPWWPAALAASLVSVRARRLTVGALGWRLARGRGGPLQRLLGLVGDLTYSTGVWASVLRSGRPGPLLPRVRGPR